MALILSLLYLIRSQCDYNIKSEIGIFKHDQELKSGETICINITYYPFYISFYDLSPSIEYNEYRSISVDRFDPEDFSYNGKDLLQIGFRSFENPYSSISLTAPNESSHVSFTYLSMPGLCTTGIYFCRSNFDSLVFERDGQNFFKIRNFDDKCLIFIPPTSTIVNFEQKSSDNYDQVFFYRNFTDYDGFSGSFSQKYYRYKENKSAMIRILSNSDNAPEKITVSFSPASLYNIRESTFYIPRHKDPQCEVIDHWYSGELIITLIVCCVFFFVLIAIILSCRFAYICRKKEKPLMIRTIN